MNLPPPFENQHLFPNSSREVEMEILGVVVMEEHRLNLRIEKKSNVSTVVGIDIPKSSVGNFMDAHMIFPLAVISVEDLVMVGGWPVWGHPYDSQLCFLYQHRDGIYFIFLYAIQFYIR